MYSWQWQSGSPGERRKEHRRTLELPVTVRLCQGCRERALATQAERARAESERESYDAKSRERWNELCDQNPQTEALRARRPRASGVVDLAESYLELFEPDLASPVAVWLGLAIATGIATGAWSYFKDHGNVVHAWIAGAVAILIPVAVIVAALARLVVAPHRSRMAAWDLQWHREVASKANAAVRHELGPAPNRAPRSVWPAGKTPSSLLESAVVSHVLVEAELRADLDVGIDGVARLPRVIDDPSQWAASASGGRAR